MLFSSHSNKKSEKFKHNHHLDLQMPSHKPLLAKSLLGTAAVVAGVLGSALQANAAIKSIGMQLERPRPDGDQYDLFIHYDDTKLFKVLSNGKYLPLPIPPSAPLMDPRPDAAKNLPGPFIATTTLPVTIPGYDPNGFTGYAITGVTGRIFDGDHNEWYEVKSICGSDPIAISPVPPVLPSPPGDPGNPNSLTFPGCNPPTFGSPADSTNGLFSEASYTQGINPLIIAHTLSDNLFKPDLVEQKVLKGIFSSGGIVFNTPYLKEKGGYNYQLFSDAANDNELAGCGSGTCAKVFLRVPGPLPLLGVGAAFGYSRTLRKRINRG